MSTTAEFNYDLLDVELDDIEDLPSFDCPPDGVYQLLLNVGTKVFEKEDGENHAVVFEYEVTDTVALNDNTDKVPVAGSKFNEIFSLSNDDGIKYLKRALLPYVEHFGTTNFKTLISESLQNVVLVGTVKARVVKKDKDGNRIDPPKRFAQVLNVQVS